MNQQHPVELQPHALELIEETLYCNVAGHGATASTAGGDLPPLSDSVFCNCSAARGWEYICGA